MDLKYHAVIRVLVHSDHKPCVSEIEWTLEPRLCGCLTCPLFSKSLISLVYSKMLSWFCHTCWNEWFEIKHKVTQLPMQEPEDILTHQNGKMVSTRQKFWGEQSYWIICNACFLRKE